MAYLQLWLTSHMRTIVEEGTPIVMAIKSWRRGRRGTLRVDHCLWIELLLIWIREIPVYHRRLRVRISILNR